LDAPQGDDQPAGAVVELVFQFVDRLFQDEGVEQGPQLRPSPGKQEGFFFQIFQVYYDMENIYKQRLKNNKIEEMSTVMSTAPY